MGCDGGTIPKRDELVRKKEKPEQKDKESELSFRWKHCSISQQPLQAPVVACGLGRLYNKDAVLEGLLDRNMLPATAQHIKGLKDVKDLRLTPNPAFKPSAEKGDAYVDRQSAPYICPVIGIEMNGKFRFVYLWGCGCVLSERALKEVKTRLCHKCQQPFLEEDIVVLNGTAEDLDLMRTKLEARQARFKAEKKARNHAKRNGKADATETSSSSQDSTTKSSVLANRSHDPKEETKPVANGEEGRQKSKSQNGKSDPKLLLKRGNKLSGVKNNVPAKRPRGSDIEDPIFKKTKLSYSVANDPDASDVFKSLFTSHQKAQQQKKAHWITYNPFYN